MEMTEGFLLVQEFVQSLQYSEAIETYYRILGKQYYCDYTKELLYLKRLAQEPLVGRDLLYFLPPSSRTDIVKTNLSQYVDLINEVLTLSRTENRRMPIDILVDCVPTMEILVRDRNSKYKFGVNILDGKYEFSKFFVEETHFTLMWDKCISGIMFDKFPDPVIYCRALEWDYPKTYFGFWILNSPEEIERNIYSKGLHINRIEVYLHKSWRFGSIKRRPDFSDAKLISDTRKEVMPTSVITSNEPGDIRFTGRTHKIEGKTFFEIDVLWKSDFQTAIVVANPLLEKIDEILKEAENRLRESKGIPRIGEGWVMETLLYKMVSEYFPNTLQHASPQWLKPQHLDIFIPTKNFAIEYHGRQHYEPVEFFGGKEAFTKTKQRDKRKMNLCRINGVKLVNWHYDTPVTKKQLLTRFRELGLNVNE